MRRTALSDENGSFFIFGGRAAFWITGDTVMKWGGIFFTWERITSEHETKDRTIWGQTATGRTEQFTSVRVDNTSYKINCSKLSKITCNFIPGCPIAQLVSNVNILRPHASDS